MRKLIIVSFLWLLFYGCITSMGSRFERAKKSCDGEDNEGCFNLGVIYEKGEGVEKNYQKALDFYDRACDLGNNLGCKNYILLKREIEK